MANAAQGKPTIPASPAHAGGKGASKAGKAAQPAVKRQASAEDSYRLSHQPRQVDTYQKAVTPQVTAGR